MEMHQVRYFLALARTLNFTRAADECNVTQPSLTRAIKLLEHELGGELLRRERGLTHLTELGRRMLPLLTQCHESAVGARSVAAALKARKVVTLRLALPYGVSASAFAPHLAALLGVFSGLALDLQRDGAAATAEALREGDADLAIAEPAAMGWERFESWPLFTEPYLLAFGEGHRFAERPSVALPDLQGERLVMRRRGEASAVEAALADAGVDVASCVTVAEDDDAAAMLRAGAAVTLTPASGLSGPALRRAPVEGLEMTRALRVWAVQGRLREPPAAMLLTQLRAADWADYAVAGPAPSA